MTVARYGTCESCGLRYQLYPLSTGGAHQCQPIDDCVIYRTGKTVLSSFHAGGKKTYVAKIRGGRFHGLTGYGRTRGDSLGDLLSVIRDVAGRHVARLEKLLARRIKDA